MPYRFRWNKWNEEHIGLHGVSPAEAEYLIEQARAPYPQAVGDDRFLVIGQTATGEHLQVVYVFDPPEEVFVIHARPLTDREKRRLRRRRR